MPAGMAGIQLSTGSPRRGDLFWNSTTAGFQLCVRATMQKSTTGLTFGATNGDSCVKSGGQRAPGAVTQLRKKVPRGEVFILQNATVVTQLCTRPTKQESASGSPSRATIARFKAPAYFLQHPFFPKRMHFLPKSTPILSKFWTHHRHTQILAFPP